MKNLNKGFVRYSFYYAGRFPSGPIEKKNLVFIQNRNSPCLAIYNIPFHLTFYDRCIC
jgi:hypothetical protein